MVIVYASSGERLGCFYAPGACLSQLCLRLRASILTEKKPQHVSQCSLPARAQTLTPENSVRLTGMALCGFPRPGHVRCVQWHAHRGGLRDWSRPHPPRPLPLRAAPHPSASAPPRRPRGC